MSVVEHQYYHPNNKTVSNHPRYGQVSRVVDKALISTSKRMFSEVKTNSSLTNVLSSGNSIYFTLKPQKYHRISNVALKLDIKESGSSNSITLPFVGAMIEKIEIREEDNSGRIISKQFDDTMLFNYNIIQSDDSKRTNDRYTGLRWNRTDGLVDAGSTRTFILPLDGTWLNEVNPFITQVKSDIRVEVYFKSTNTVSGSGTATVNSASLEIEHEKMSQNTFALTSNQFLSSAHVSSFLNVVKMEHSDSWAASSTLEWDIPMNVCSPFILLTVRASKATTSNAYRKFIPLGDNTTIDVQTASGNSVIAEGSALKISQLKTIMAREVPSWFADQEVYCIPFGTVKSALKGHIHGYEKLRNKDHKIVISTTTAVQNAVATINCTSAANDGGYYRLSWNGEATDDLKFDTSAAAMKAAVEEFLPFKEYPNMAVTMSGTAATDFTITFSGVDFDPIKRWGLPVLEVINLNDGTVEDIVSGSQTQEFVSGYHGGSATLITNAYVYYFNEVYQTVNGDLSLEHFA